MGQSEPRRILAGIDEAGYGPILGPLVIGATAWSIPEECDGSDLWHRLRGGVGRTPGKRAVRLAINDSKKIYSSQKGLADLERGVLGSLAAQAPPRPAGSEGGPAAWPSDLRGLLDRLAPGWAEQVAEHPWYESCADVALPAESDSSDLATRANGLKVAMRRGGVGFLGAGLELVLEGRFNRLAETIGNKGRMLFCCTARLIQRLLDRFGGERLTVVCDKQGGRDSYRSLLQQHWPDLHLTVLDESSQRSGYRLADGPSGRGMEIWFRAQADTTCLPVSLASMYCKYTRELFMRLLNRFWQARVGPSLRATAGYYRDGQRFLGQVAEAARRLGLPRERFVRSC